MEIANAKHISSFFIASSHALFTSYGLRRSRFRVEKAAIEALLLVVGVEQRRTLSSLTAGNAELVVLDVCLFRWIRIA